MSRVAHKRLQASSRNSKTTLDHNSHRGRFRGLCRGVIGRLQYHFHHVAVGLPFAVRHCPAIDIHRRLNAGMAHQFALYSNWCFGLVQPRPEAMPEGLPSDPGCDLRSFRRSFDVLLLNFLLMDTVCPWRDWRTTTHPASCSNASGKPVARGSALGRLARHRVNTPSSRLQPCRERCRVEPAG